MPQPAESQQENLHNSASSKKALVVVSGATGGLGGCLVEALLDRGASVRALVRKSSGEAKVAALKRAGAEIKLVDYSSLSDLTSACKGAACVVSALSGLEDVIVDTQTLLLEAAVAAGVPRFIPSDFAIDFTKLPYGTNRNLDLRKKFKERLDKAPIAATSILNGMFTDLLLGEAPVVLFPIKRVLYWGNADQPMDFTTIENTAEFTAAAALEQNAPRYLRIAGDVQSTRGLQAAATQATGKQFGLLRPGSLSLFDVFIKITRTLAPAKDEVFPAWQGMQYMRNMLSGITKLEPLDNNRYPGINWTSVQEVLAEH